MVSLRKENRTQIDLKTDAKLQKRTINQSKATNALKLTELYKLLTILLTASLH